MRLVLRIFQIRQRKPALRKSRLTDVRFCLCKELVSPKDFDFGLDRKFRNFSELDSHLAPTLGKLGAPSWD